MLLYTFIYSIFIRAALGCSSRHGKASTSSDAVRILGQSIQAIGGLDVLNSIVGLSYEASALYRSQTLTQSYGLRRSDQSVSTTGSQVMSFREYNNSLQERIDRAYQYNDYWIWAFPDLSPPINYSLVLQDGLDGYACFLKGQNNFYANDPSIAAGYADPYLTDYLVQQAHQFALPWMLKQFARDDSKLRVLDFQDSLTNASLPALEHVDLGLTLILNSTTYLPYMIRSYEEHTIYGHSTNDVLLSNYSILRSLDNESILLPHRIQTVYNTFNMIENFIVDKIYLNPSWPDAFFDPLPESQSQTPRTPPLQSTEYQRSEVHEFFETALWNGPFGEAYNVSDVHVEYPVPGFKAIRSLYIGYPDYLQLLVEFSDGLLITDAPPHRSKIILEWVKQNVGKNITHVVPSHHHRDHAGGIADYVAAGAKVVVPAIAREFYTDVNAGAIAFETYTQERPFVLSDSTVQFRSFWREEAPHAVDWSYGVATAACPRSDIGVVIFNADVVDPGSFPGSPTSDALRWDAGYARQWVIAAAEDGVPKSALIVGAHGSVRNRTSNAETLIRVADITGVIYPEISVQSWAVGDVCHER